MEAWTIVLIPCLVSSTVDIPTPLKRVKVPIPWKCGKGPISWMHGRLC